MSLQFVSQPAISSGPLYREWNIELQDCKTVNAGSLRLVHLNDTYISLDKRYPCQTHRYQETRRQKTSQIFPELKTHNAYLHDGCEDPRLLMKPSLLSMRQVHQAMPVGLHNFPMKQPGNCDGNATRNDERQLFGDLGGQTGIAYVTSGGEIDAYDSYRNIPETGAYGGQVHDLSLVL
ncbi:hypothetical protein BFJ72_g2422 [Fusarium proliferatum]|uniref:Uncharacterized protein n=1 Tax=Gibberella intermedia TaxID=948311 RepID=A0A420TYK6_GIBIN|nr:hypothetical protein BFJ72_g2422 [Fusarium proliferatum]